MGASNLSLATAFVAGLISFFSPCVLPLVPVYLGYMTGRVSLSEAYAAYQDLSAVFVDVRGAESFDAGHIPGAVHIPLADLASRLNELSKEDWILLYCT